MWIVVALFIIYIINVSSSTSIHGFEPYVYGRVSPELVISARRIGSTERLNYINEISHVSSEDEKNQLFLKHFATCATVGEKVSNSLTESLAFLTSNAESRHKVGTVLSLLEAIGVDEVPAAIMVLPVAEMAATIDEACLKNELQFQCAEAFLNDRNAVDEHIARLMQQDGNVKFMFESECRRPEAAIPVYSCIGQSMLAIDEDCHYSIKSYNKTRRAVNSHIQAEYNGTMTRIEAALDEAENSDTVYAEAEDQMRNVFDDLLRHEAYKCRSFYIMERCLAKSVNEKCGNSAVGAVKTLLRAGYLQRERGDNFHSHLLQAQIPTSSACLKVFDA